MQLYFKFTSNSIQSNEEEKAMISFFICLALLIGGYFVYGKVVENTFAPDDRETPAVKINDGVDYVVMPQWKLFLVQLLNIAGLGPIFGAMQGALWGPVVFLWITFGTIFAGGVHDYFSGMLSERNNGASISEVCGIYLGGCYEKCNASFQCCITRYGRYRICSWSGRTYRNFV